MINEWTKNERNIFVIPPAGLPRRPAKITKAQLETHEASTSKSKRLTGFALDVCNINQDNKF